MLIKPSETFCNDYDSLSRLAHETGQPIYLTRQGEGDVVILSLEAYDALAHTTSPAPAVPPITKKEGMNMTETTLGRILRALYDEAARGAQVANIHAFSIYYADIIDRQRLNKKEILRAAGLSENYQTEISKGVNLAAYVEIKETYAARIRQIEAQMTAG